MGSLKTPPGELFLNNVLEDVRENTVEKEMMARGRGVVGPHPMYATRSERSSMIKSDLERLVGLIRSRMKTLQHGIEMFNAQRGLLSPFPTNLAATRR